MSKALKEYLGQQSEQHEKHTSFVVITDVGIGEIYENDVLEISSVFYNKTYQGRVVYNRHLMRWELRGAKANGSPPLGKFNCAGWHWKKLEGER